MVVEQVEAHWLVEVGLEFQQAVDLGFRVVVLALDFQLQQVVGSDFRQAVLGQGQQVVVEGVKDHQVVKDCLEPAALAAEAAEAQGLVPETEDEQYWLQGCRERDSGEGLLLGKPARAVEVDFLVPERSG